MNLSLFIYRKLKTNTDKSNISSRIIKIAIFSVFIGIFVSLTAVSIGKGLQFSIKEILFNISSDITISSYENNNRGIASEIINESEDVISKIKTLYPDIKINYTIEKPSIIKINNSIETIIFRGVKDQLNFKKFDQFIIDKLNDKPKILNDIIISKSLLEKLNISIGNNITLYFQTFENQKIPNIRYYRVYGVYETDFPNFDSNYIIGDIESIQNLYKLNSNDVGAIELIIDDKDLVMDIENNLSYQDLFLNNNLTIVTIKDKYNNIFNWISIFDFNILIVIVLMIIVAIISIIISMLTLIFERIKMIGIMSSMGADNKLLGKVFVYQGIDILLRGIIPGNILFIIVSFVQNNYNILKLNPDDYYVDSIPFIVDPIYIISINLVFVFFGIIVLFVTFSSITRFVPTININT
ncbi:MAG: ABC transporter permease [Bacteroidetes bacterium]|nr:ABC transporter permease [Bacteroidota bacterium]MDA1225420.1 ABC transporter permease [Bacteroidota bacterium]